MDRISCKTQLFFVFYTHLANFFEIKHQAQINYLWVAETSTNNVLVKLTLILVRFQPIRNSREDTISIFGQLIIIAFGIFKDRKPLFFSITCPG